MQKRIFVYYPGGLVPTVMMSQARALNQILTLRKDHSVVVSCLCTSEKQNALHFDFFEEKGIGFYPVFHRRYNKSKVDRFIINIFYHLKFTLFLKRIAYSANSDSFVITQFSKLFNIKKFDVVIAHYWYGSEFLRLLDDKTYKVIDNHCLVEEDIELNKKGYYYRANHFFERSFFKKSLDIQKKVFRFANMIVLNSAWTYEFAMKAYSENLIYYCPNGLEMDKYENNEPMNYDPNLILFYGSMGGKQNIRAFRLFYYNVWPKIVNSNPDAKLLILGNNPPKWIHDLSKNRNIEVTGFVNDVREYIRKACCMVLTMDVGVGFRGRVIEVMAMGIPVVGNFNALDCIGIKHEVNGYVDDDYDELVNHVMNLMADPDLRLKISDSSRLYVNMNYSVSKTFEAFSSRLYNI